MEEEDLDGDGGSGIGPSKTDWHRGIGSKRKREREREIRANRGRFIRREGEIEREQGGGGEGGGGPEWADLIRDCLIDILSRMSLEELWRGAMLVCKSWMSASTDFYLHTALDLDPFFKSSSSSSDFQGKIDALIHKVVVRSQGYLSLLRTRNCSDATLSFVAQRCPNLEVLSIKSSPGVTDKSFLQDSFKCVKLRELDLSYCYKISFESLVKIGKSCPNLRVLKRNFIFGFVPNGYHHAHPNNGDSEATAIGAHMPSLEHLEIRLSKLTVTGLEVVCRRCKNLKYLDLNGCLNLTRWGIDRATQELTRLKVRWGQPLNAWLC